jgi:hypothetical protein
MFTSTDLKAIISEARPVIERRLDDTAIIAGFRETVTAKGGDWSQIKALVTAMIQDERDESGGSKRVRALLSKADHALGYADMLGLGNLNEKNSFADDGFDPETGEIIEPNSTAPIPPGVAADAEEQTHSSDAGSSAPIQPDTEPANQSTAARMDGHGLKVSGSTPAGPDARLMAEEAVATTNATLYPATKAELGAGTQAPPVDTSNVRAFPKLKMNPEFFEPPHPSCKRPEFCGGNSNLGLCEDCRVAAGMLTVEAGGHEIPHQGEVA